MSTPHTLELCVRMSRTCELVSQLEKVAKTIRSEGSIHSDCFDNAEVFASEIEKLATLITESGYNPFKCTRVLFLRKKAKYTWASPSFDLDDFLSGVPNSENIAQNIYELL